MKHIIIIAQTYMTFGIKDKSGISVSLFSTQVLQIAF